MSVTAKLYDLGSNEVADISQIALERTLNVALNGSRSFVINAQANHPLLTAIADDGYPNLRKGNRKLLVWEDGEIIFHGRVFVIERIGDGTRNRATITAFDPLMELGYDAAERAGRVVRDVTGNFIDPEFVSSVDSGAAISGPDLIKQVLENSQGTGTESDPNPGEGPLPISLTGDFDLLVPPAVDLSVIDSMSWPVYIGDFIAQIVATNVTDIFMRPVDPSEGFDPYVMVEMSAVSRLGSDLSGTVHFDYWTGSKNAKSARHVEDFSTICNKLYDYLGPREDTEHWRGNITPGSPGTTVDPTASRALYGGPGTDKGTFMFLRILDSLGVENSSRPLYIALWNAEQGMRVEPRDLIFITPNAGSKALFHAPADFDAGDLIGVNVGDALGITLAEAQRVYGYSRTWSREDVPSLSQLVTSADFA